MTAQQESGPVTETVDQSDPTTPQGGQATPMWGHPSNGSGESDGGGRGGRFGGGGRRRGGRGGRGGGGGRGEQPMVPDAEFASYYGRPVVRPPVWEPEIAAYLFTGGLAGGSSLLAAGADLSGAPALRRASRVTALGAVGASAYLLIKDLGRIDRFHHMLRVFKVTSPMSVGTWILTAYGPLAGAAAVAEVAPLLPDSGVLGLAKKVAGPAGRAAGIGAALFAPALATYTAVLFADTAVPSWNEPYRELPFMFAGSALGAAGGAGMLLAPVEQAGPARRVAVLGSAMELAAGHRVEHDHGLASEPFDLGRAGRLMTAARVLTTAGAAGALFGRRSRVLSGVAGAALLAGSIATRFGVFEAGVTSTKDPKYTVVPQRERLARKQAAVAGHPESSSDR